jgi:hypothetical protein
VLSLCLLNYIYPFLEEISHLKTRYQLGHSQYSVVNTALEFLNVLVKRICDLICASTTQFVL